MMSALTRIYAEGGVAAFWVGNGLSVAKILPESAIKFMTYEASVCPPSRRRGGWSTPLIVWSPRNVSSLIMWTT